MTGYIYKCTFRNKIYIGESVNALNPKYLGTGGLWKSTIDGHEFEVSKEILETIEAQDKKTLKQRMHEREIYWIAYYDSTNPDIGYNVSPGGNTMTEESIAKMKLKDSESIKRIMQTTDCRKRISKSLKQYKQENGVSIEHRQNLSKKLKGRKVGCSGDSRSIQIYCIINGEQHYFHSKILAAEWWFNNYPFSDNYAEITYTRMITKSINGEPLSYKGKSINQSIEWFLDNVDFNNIQEVYCIFNNKRYDFCTIEEAITWWHENYPIQNQFDYGVYYNKLTKNILGFAIERHSKKYDLIRWYRKE